MKYKKKLAILTKQLENINFLSDSEFVVEEESEEKSDEPPRSYVLGVDIGINNLGLSLISIDDEFNFVDVKYINLLNISKYTHDVVPKEQCYLNHTKTFSDWLTHVFQEHYTVFNSATYIIIERQPPMGLVACEQLIYNRWRSKAHLVSPNSMHKYFRIGKYDYEKRKKLTESISRRYIKNPILVSNFDRYTRRHDIADSVCIVIFWLFQKITELTERKNKERIMNRQLHIRKPTGMTTNEWFEQFRYIPCLT